MRPEIPPGGPKGLPGGRRLAAGVVTALVLYGLASIRHLADSEAGVREGALLASPARLLASGWHVVPRGLFRLSLYQTGERTIRFGPSGPLEARTPEGAAVTAAGSVDLAVDLSRLLLLHEQAGRSGDSGVETLVRREAARCLADALAEAPGSALPGAGASASARLAVALEGAGLTVREIRIETPVLAAGGRGGGVGPRATPRKVLWLAVDAFDWEIIRPLVEAGRMPHMARLLERGAWGNLRSITPMLSPVLWTSVATGKLPGKHGIVDFVATDPATGAMVPVTSTLRRARAFWNILGDAGVSVGVIAWWASFPAERVNGFLCTDRIAYQLFKGRIRESLSDDPLKTFPAGLYARIAPLIRPPESVRLEDLSRFLDVAKHADRFTGDDRSRLDDLRTLVAATETYAGIGRALFTERPTDLRVIYFEGPDTAAHLFMPFMPPARPGVDPAMVERFGRVVPEFYSWQDEVLGAFIDAYADAETTVIVSSDHGFLSGEDRPATESRISHGRAADWHDRDGMILLAGPGVRAGARILGASVLDLLPTLLTLYGMPVARDMDGKPLEGAFTPDFLEVSRRETIATYESGGPAHTVAAAPAAGDEEARELLAKLESLGYVQQDRPTARLNQGAIFMQEGDYDRAVTEFRAALSRMNEDGARFSLARALRLARRPAEAEAELDRLAAKGFRAAALLTERAALRRDAGDPAGAEALLRQAVAAEPGYAEAHILNGRLQESRDRWDAAVESYRLAAEADPRHAEALNQLGLALLHLGREGEALRHFEETIRVLPDLPGPYNNLGLIYRQRGDLEKARAILETGVTMAPRSALLRNSLGSLLLDAGLPDEAMEQVRQAAAIAPDDPASISNLATLHMARREAAEAEPLWRRLLTLEPENRDATVSLALSLIAQGRRQEAERLLADALVKAPGDPKALLALGELRLREGREAEALPLFETASRLKDAPPRVWNALARCYLAARRTGEARRALRRSLELDPAQPEVARQLAAIGG